MNVLICGAGVAGPTLAYWLARFGFHPTIVERAPALRAAGYVVDFWGTGYEVARRMGVLPDILAAGYTVREVRAVASDGHTVAAFPAQIFASAVGSAFTSVPRGDLAAALYRSLDDHVETIFGDTPVSIVETGRGVDVTFEHHQARSFDLVVGADGLHSRVRALAFGPEATFERYMGIKVAAATLPGYRPRDELTYVMYSRIGQQVSRFAMRDDRTMVLFTFADSDPSIPDNAAQQKKVLRDRFGASGWECAQILNALESADDLYFDRVSQIDMGGSWTRGRVTLLGDSAFCVSLLGGQGSALAMSAAYILAGELHRAAGDYARAFGRYERIFAPFVAGKQRAARRFAGTFAPTSSFSLFLRNQVFRLLSIPLVAKAVAGRGFSDALVLPDY